MTAPNQLDSIMTYKRTDASFSSASPRSLPLAPQQFTLGSDLYLSKPPPPPYTPGGAPGGSSPFVGSQQQQGRSHGGVGHNAANERSSSAAAATAAARRDGWAAREAADRGARRSGNAAPRRAAPTPHYSQRGTQDEDRSQPHSRRRRGNEGSGGGGEESAWMGSMSGNGAGEGGGGFSTPAPAGRPHAMSGTHQQQREGDDFVDGEARAHGGGREVFPATGPDGDGGRWVTGKHFGLVVYIARMEETKNDPLRRVLAWADL